tara:strand:+ start:45 stop:362 length:318 start_codon:yes stop_codon:yes gene_type:complete
MTKIHGKMFDKERDGRQLRSVRDCALDFLIDSGGWHSGPEIHEVVVVVYGRACREDSPRRMMNYIHNDPDCPWDIESQPSASSPGTAEYRATRRATPNSTQQHIF